MSLSTEYPLWLLLPALPAAAAVSWYLYHRNKLDLTGRFGRIAWIALMAFRFLAISLIVFLLLGPLLKLINRKVEKPFIVIALDNSESVVAGKNGAAAKTEFPEAVKKLAADLGEDYDVRTYTFGKEVREAKDLTFTDKQTDISNALSFIGNTYANQNLGAVILATDGIYNEGSNPLYEGRELKAPVFTVALGDTNQRTDLLIKNVRHNQLVYQGNRFPMQVDVSAFGCTGKSTTLTVSHQEKTLLSQPLPVTAQQFFATIPLELEAATAGTQHYTITLSSLPGEASYVNNRFDVFINVINGKQKILILALSPHPDLSAYKQAIAMNENYEVNIQFAERADPAKMSGYDLVMLHQLPGMRGEGANIVRFLREKKVPLLYVLGSQTGVQALNTADNRINITGNRQNTNESQPAFNPSFALFTLTDEETEAIRKFPPLTAPYGNYRINAEADVLFRQQIGYVASDLPLVFFTRQGGERAGFVCGEGFWKWRLYDADISGQRTANSLAGKIVQFLAVKADNRLLRVTGRKRFDENERITFDAELYNESYELINTPELLMKIRDPKGKIFTYTFSKTDKAYALDAGILPTGSYTYEATATVGSRTEKAAGSFAITPLQVEFLQTVADHQLLNEMASATGGQVFSPAQLDKLGSAIRSNEAIKPVSYIQEEVKSWINLKWVCLLLIALMGAEWFVRKWNGSV